MKHTLIALWEELKHMVVATFWAFVILCVLGPFIAMGLLLLGAVVVFLMQLFTTGGF